MTQSPGNTSTPFLNHHKLRLLGLSLLTILTFTGCDRAPNTVENTNTAKKDTKTQEQYLSKEQKALNKFIQTHQKEINAAGSMPFNEFYSAEKICRRPQHPSVNCRAINLINEERFNTEIKRLDQTYPGEQLKAHNDTACTAIPANNTACDMSHRALRARQHP